MRARKDPIEGVTLAEILLLRPAVFNVRGRVEVLNFARCLA